MCQANAARPTSQSLLAQGWVEAERFKWIESEKARKDLGDAAIRLWVQTHWHGFLRARWIEHLEGRTFWMELHTDDFGLLHRAFPDSVLFPVIIDRLRDGEENLDIIVWALTEGQPMDEIYDILEALDINSQRIEWQVASQLSMAG